MHNFETREHNIYNYILVIDVPTVNYLSSLCGNEKFKQYLSRSFTEPERSDLVLHFAPPQVIETEEYRAFVNLFPNSTQHLVLNEHNT